ncbi:hypothetical protein D3C80_1798560 [compost metagenome]
MLKTGPKVHRDRPDLHLYANIFLPVGYKYRHLYNKVQAAIAIRLRIFNIILHLQQHNIALVREHRANLVYIRNKRACNAQPRYIPDVSANAVKGQLIIFAVQLLYNALRRLDAGAGMLNRVIFMQ